MKTKEEILKMTKQELIEYKLVADLGLKKENSYCFNCSYCFDCSNCSNCSYCKNLQNREKHQYKICNVQLTKEEYEGKIKKLKNEN